jgi:DNA-binding transcriptional LysR family regulator
MNWKAISFDWNQVRAFLATAEEGPLSAAARALGLTQPTLGRQVAALEETLGVTLFDRAGRALHLTPTGIDLLEHVRAMGDAAARVSMAASGQSQAVEGHVTITASDVLSAYVLPDVISDLREAAPGITVDIVASNALSDLGRREADIAIRHVRPEQPDLIARLLQEVPATLFASRDWVRTHGMPLDPSEMAARSFVGPEPPDEMMQWLQAQGIAVSRANFPVLTSSGVVYWEMVRRGLGAGVMVRDIARVTPDVVELLPELTPVPVPYWLVTRRELHTSRRIRIVFDHLAQAFSNP